MLVPSVFMLAIACGGSSEAPASQPVAPPKLAAVAAAPPVAPAPPPAVDPEQPVERKRSELDGVWRTTCTDCDAIALYLFENEGGQLIAQAEITSDGKLSGSGLAAGPRTGNHVKLDFTLAKVGKRLPYPKGTVFEGDLVEGELRGSIGTKALTFTHHPWPGPAFADTPESREQVEVNADHGNIGCIYSPRTGDSAYIAGHGGPELSCDRVEPRYVRAQLGPDGPPQLMKRVGDASCCVVNEELVDGKPWTRGPFTCVEHAGELTCKRSDGPGFVLSKTKFEATP
jgi:hypothetical protein